MEPPVGFEPTTRKQSSGLFAKRGSAERPEREALGTSVPKRLHSLRSWSRLSDLNRRPMLYEIFYWHFTFDRVCSRVAAQGL